MTPTISVTQQKVANPPPDTDALEDLCAQWEFYYCEKMNQCGKKTIV